MSQQQPVKSKQIITINIGGCGVNLGALCLEQQCSQQSISGNGKIMTAPAHNSVDISFKESSNGRYYARTLFADLDPYPINLFKNTHPYADVLPTNGCVYSKAANGRSNFAVGYYTCGKELIDSMNDRIRMMVEDCDNLQGFQVHHSVAGGTGSGFAALVLERLAVDYRKKCKVGFEVFPDERRAVMPHTVYNMLLSFHWMLDHTEISVLFDNWKTHDICARTLGIKVPRFSHYNAVYNKLIACLTAEPRLGVGADFDTFAKNMVPFPRLHFLTCSLGSMQPKQSGHDIGTKQLLENSLQYEHMLQYFGSGYPPSKPKAADDSKKTAEAEIEEKENEKASKMSKQKQKVQKSEDNDRTRAHVPYDCEKDKYLAMYFVYRGKNAMEAVSAANESVISLRKQRKYEFVNWTASAEPSISFVASPNVAFASDITHNDENQLAMIGNNVAIMRMLNQRIVHKYDLLYSQRAYVHWFVGEGGEEGELAEAREDMGFLEKDYLDVLTEQGSSQDSYDHDNTTNNC